MLPWEPDINSLASKTAARLPAYTVEGLLKPEAKATLTKVLTCHVVGAKAMSEAVMKMVKNDGGKVTVMDETGSVADVTNTNVEQSNGVVVVIDKLLLPKE